MEQMSRWLQVLRLQKYIPVFEQHRMTVKRLSSTSDAELANMGLPVGPRKKLLAYLGVMRAALTQSSQGTQPDSQAAPPPSRYSEDDPTNKPCTHPSESSKAAGSPSTRHTSTHSPLSTQHPNIPRGSNYPTSTDTQHAQQLASYPPARSAHPNDSHGQKRPRQQFSPIQPTLVRYPKYAGNKTRSTYGTSNVAKTSGASLEAKSIHPTINANKTAVPTLAVKHVHTSSNASSNAIKNPVPTLVSNVSLVPGYGASRAADRLQGSCARHPEQKQVTLEERTVDLFRSDDGSALADGSHMKRVRAADVGAEVGGWSDGLRSRQQRSSSCSHWGPTTRVDPVPPEPAKDARRQSVCWGLGSDCVSQPNSSQSAGRERGGTGCARDNTSCEQGDLDFEQGVVGQNAGCGQGNTGCEEGRMDWEWGVVGCERGSTSAELSTTGSQAGTRSNPMHRPPPTSACKLLREPSLHTSHDTSSGSESLSLLQSSPRGTEGCTAVRNQKRTGVVQGSQLVAVTTPRSTRPCLQPGVRLPAWRQKEQELLPVLYPERPERTGTRTSPGSTPELPACRIKRRRLIPADGLWSSAASSVQMPITRWAATQPSARGASVRPTITPAVSKGPDELSQLQLSTQEQLQASRTEAQYAISPPSAPQQTTQLAMPVQLQPPCTMANSPVRAHYQPLQLRLREQLQPPYMAVQHPASARQQTPQLRLQEQLQPPPTAAQYAQHAQLASSPVTPASDLKSSCHGPHPPARTPAPAAAPMVCPTPTPPAQVPGSHRYDAAATGLASHTACCTPPLTAQVPSGHRREAAAADAVCPAPPPSAQVPGVSGGHRCDAAACMAEYGLSGVGCKQACIPTGEEPDPGEENLRLVALRKELQAAEKLVARLKLLIWECKLDMSDPEELGSEGNMQM